MILNTTGSDGSCYFPINRPRSFSFSQIISNSSVSGIKCTFRFAVQALVYALNPSTAFGAILRRITGPSVKLNPKNFRSCGRATALFLSLP